jgi:hypothetical protein
MCAGLVAFGFTAWVAVILVNGIPSTLLNAVFAFGLFVPLWWLMLAERRIRRRLRENDYRLCPKCGHSLLGLEESGQCPECGRAFVVAAVRETWAGTGLARRAEMRAMNRPG